MSTGQRQQQSSLLDDVLTMLVRGVWWVICHAPRTLAWFGITTYTVITTDTWPMMWFLVGAFMLALVGLAYRPAWRLLRWSSPVADFGPLGRAWEKHAVTGLQLLDAKGKRARGVRTWTDERGDRHVTWPATLRPMTQGEVARASEAMWAAMGAVRHDVTIQADGTWHVAWSASKPADPLDDLLVMEPLLEPYAWSGDWRRVPFGRHCDGSLATLRVAECSGTVVGGLPGGGKTAGLTTLLSPLVASSAVQFLVWDGKGGADWAWLTSRAALYNPDDEDRQRVADELEAVVQVMRERLRQMSTRRGGSSIWTTGGPSTDMPLLVLVVDECQAYLDVGAILRGDKAALEARQRSEAALASLVRKGRTAGIWVIPTTQKPTADSLPTTIGANAAAAVSFRVKTPEAERAVLGSGPGDGEPSSTDLPTSPGFAVLATEAGTREVVRFGYLPESVAAAHAQAHAHLRRDVIHLGGAA